MERVLRTEAIGDAMAASGLNQAAVARELDVSREAVSKWLKGRSTPRPDKLLRLALLLDLTLDQMVARVPDAADPVVAFRKMGARKTTEAHIARAQKMGRLLEPVVPFLPFDELVVPPVLKEPRLAYEYVERVAGAIRAEIGLDASDVLDFEHLIHRFRELQAVLIPVLWGARDRHENALHIHLPESATTWVYLNLDSEVHDFKFWMAHELAHVLAPRLHGDKGEDFADSLASALLYPRQAAEAGYRDVRSLRGGGARMNVVKGIARELTISPITVHERLRCYAESEGLPAIDLGNAIYGAARNVNREYRTVSEALFGDGAPEPAEYIRVSRELFESPFYDALAACLGERPRSAGYVQSVLDIPLLDAKAIHSELV